MPGILLKCFFENLKIGCNMSHEIHFIEALLVTRVYENIVHKEIFISRNSMREDVYIFSYASFKKVIYIILSKLI